MSKDYLSSIFVLFLVCVLGGITYACFPVPPTADIASLGVGSVYVGETVFFDGSGSFDGDNDPPDPGIVAYRWIFPPQAYAISGEDTAYAKCKFYPADTYRVYLEVKDDEGVWSDAGVEYCDVVVDAATSTDWYVKTDGDDDNDGTTLATAFANIQTGIDSASQGDTVHVAQGTYSENINFRNRDITLKSHSDNTAMPVIDGSLSGSVVIFSGDEGNTNSCTLDGFKIINGWVGEPTENLVAHWKLDETTGATAPDSAGVGNYDGTLEEFADPSSSWTTDGRIDGALGFDGEGYVEITGYKGISGSDSRTCSAWIKTDQSDTYEIITWGSTGIAGEMWLVQIQTGKLRVAIWGSYKIGTTTINDGQWHHVAVVLPQGGSSDDIELYVDGFPEATTNGSDIPVTTAVGNDVVIGSLYYGGSYVGLFNGQIDDVRVYSRELAAEEIAELANNGLVAHWKLDDDPSTTAEDSWGDNDGTISGATWAGSGEGKSGEIGDNALDFDGSDDSVDMNASAVNTLQEGTISIWINPPSDGSGAFFGLTNTDGWEYIRMAYVNATQRVNWVIKLDGVFVVFAHSPVDSVLTGKWTHIAVAVDASGHSMYINGQKQVLTYNGNGDPSVPYFFDDPQGTNLLSLGKRDIATTQYDSYYKGKIDDFRIYGRALTSAEISRVYLDKFVGGGILGNGTNADISNCVIEGNTADYGGGIYGVDGAITNCVIAGNTVIEDGGGLHSCDGTITNCVISGNIADNGGGMWNVYGSPTVTNCTFSGNSATDLGGGMCSYNASPTVINCMFNGNSAEDGGGMWNFFGTVTGAPTITNCVFSGNSATEGGGGMSNKYFPIYSDPIVTNCTFSGNSARYGGGIENFYCATTVSNCILWGNTATIASNEIFNISSTPLISYCDIAGCLPWDSSMGTDGGGNIDADPMFVDAPNGNYHLRVGSPCKNAGSLALTYDGQFDMDGQDRDADGHVDIGADEYIVNGARYQLVPLNQEVLVYPNTLKEIELLINGPDGNLIDSSLNQGIEIIIDDEDKPARGYLSNKDNSELTISYTNTNLDMNQSDSFEYSVYSDLYGYSSKATVKLVFPENEAPVIDAGSDQTVTIGEDGTVTVNLAGSLVKNDGYPSWPLEKTWASQGDVTFGNPNAFETTARISSCGSHYIYLNVDDGLAESQDYVVINVKPRQVDEFYAPTASAGAYYGGASASDGQTLVVGARNEGAVYVYTRNSLDWDYVTTLLSPNAASNFGSSVAVDNNRIVVGISDTTANEVYVYNLNGTNWETSPYVITPSESAEYFGYSIDIDGDTIVVGANHDDNQKGSAYVFDFDGTDWNQTHKLTASDGLDTFYDGGRSYGDQFGICVGIDSDLIVVGASEADTNNIHRTGKAYLFQNIVGSWSQVRDFVPSDGVEYGRFGYSLAISGQTICIGSYKANVGALSKAGKVYVYTLSGSIWDEDIITASSPGACDYFGVSIDIESDTLAVGAHGDDVGGINSGNVYVFARNNDSWTETEYNLPNSSAGDNYGISVALAGDVLFAGARHSSGAISDSGSMARILLIDGPHIPFINNILLDVDQNHPVDFTLVQDADSTGWTYHVIGLPEHGLLSGDAPELTFLADSDYQGLDVITFRAFNGYYYSNEAIVDINIAIPGQNKAPVIDAGGDHSETSEESPIIGTMDVTLPNPAFLEGTASDDDLPRGILNYQWTVVSAPVGVEPSEVEFDRPNTLDPLAFLPEVGVYELCLTVDDNKLSSSDTIRITVFPKVEFSASNNHLMVKLGTDKIWSCGNNSAGGDSLEKLGRSGITSLLLPVENGAMQTESDYLEGIKQVEGAAHHSVALDTAGDVWTWGCNATQELGMACYSDWEESRATQTRPDYVAYEPSAGNYDYLGNIKKVAASNYSLHNIALDESGLVWAWGQGGNYELGRISYGTSGEPKKVVGGYQSLDFIDKIEKDQLDPQDPDYIDFDIDAYYDQFNQDNGYFLENIIDVFAGQEFSAALEDNGRLWVWGSAELVDDFVSYAALVKSSTNIKVPVPILKGEQENNDPDGCLNVVGGSAGYDCFIALENKNPGRFSSDGRALIWGDLPEVYYDTISNNTLPEYVLAGEQADLVEYANLGEDANGDSKPDRLMNLVQVGIGRSHALALERLDYTGEDPTAQGRVYAWGYNTSIYSKSNLSPENITGQLGVTISSVLSDPVNYYSETPRLVKKTDGTPLTDIVYVEAGKDFSIAVDSENVLWVWGDGSSGQLGIGTYDNALNPIPVRVGNQVVRELRDIGGGQMNTRKSFISIQDAIGDAGTVDDDILTVYPGTYYEDINIDKAVTVKSVDPKDPDVVSRTIIDGHGSDYVVYIYSDTNYTDQVTLEGLTIQNGSDGIRSSSASPTIRNCRILENTTYGIYASSGAPYINNCLIFSGNSSKGVYLPSTGGSAVLENCTVVNPKGVCLEKTGSNPVTILNCIFWAENADDTLTVKPFPATDDADSYGVTYSWISNSDQLGTSGTNVTSSTVPFVNFFVFADRTAAFCSGAGNENSFYVYPDHGYVQDDVIEYDNDGVLRTVESVFEDVDLGSVIVDKVTLTDDPLHNLTSTSSWKMIKNWGQDATDIEEDFHILKSSTEIIDGGLTPDPYDPEEFDLDGNGRYLDGNDPADGVVEVDMGAYEYVANMAPEIVHVSGLEELSLACFTNTEKYLTGFSVVDDLWGDVTDQYTYQWADQPGYEDQVGITYGNANDLNTTVTFSIAGTYYLQLTVTDAKHSPADSKTDTYNVTVVVSEKNQPPVIDVKQTYFPNIDLYTGLDIDLSSASIIEVLDEAPLTELKYSWGYDAWPTVNEVQGKVYYNPVIDSSLILSLDFTQPGTYEIYLMVNDGEFIEFGDTITVDVVKNNLAPVISGVGNWAAPLKFSDPGIPDNSKNYISFDYLEISDDETALADLIYAWQITLPDGETDGAEFDDTGTLVSSLSAPQFNFSKEGVYTVDLTITDDDVSAKYSSVTFTVSVSRYNQPPIVTASVVSNGPFYVDAPVILQVTVRDDGLPAGRELSGSWALISGPENSQVSIDNLQSNNPTVTFDLDGPYALAYIVDEIVDEQVVLTGSGGIIINVELPSEDLTPNAGIDKTIDLTDEPTVVTFSDASYATSGNWVSYEWHMWSGNSWVYGDIDQGNSPDTARFGFTNAGTYYFKLTATNDQSESYSDVVVVSVNSDGSLYADESLPYSTGFHELEGYSYGDYGIGPHLDAQNGWKVHSNGKAWVETEFNGAIACAALCGNTEISKRFDSNGTHDEYIRLEIRPEYNTKVEIEYGGNVIAGVKFVDAGNNKVTLDCYGPGGYEDVSGSPEYGYLDYIKLKFEMDYSNGQYTVYSASSIGQYSVGFDNSEPVLVRPTPDNGLIYAEVGTYSMLLENPPTLDNLKVYGGCVLGLNTSKLTFINTISINGVSREEVIYKIDEPCACTTDELKGEVDVRGTVWDPWLRKYELMYCSAEYGYTDADLEEDASLEAENMNIWKVFHTGRANVEGGLLGVWDTSAIPNGYYHLGFRVHRSVIDPESSYLEELNTYIVTKKVTRISGGKLDDSSVESNAIYSVTSDLKCNTFTHVEKAEMAVQWPGILPFEFKRIYNNNRRNVLGPLAYGWTHNNHITLVEDTANFFEPIISDGVDDGYPQYDTDETKVAYGYIWVTYPDGSKHLFRHLDDSFGEGIYHQYPDINSGDYIERTTTLETDSSDIATFEYILHTRDGSKFTFVTEYVRPVSPSVELDLFDSGRLFGNLFDSVEVGVKYIEDRFGNTLEYQWFDEDSDGIEDAEALEAVYYQRPSDCIGMVFGRNAGTGLYDSVELRTASDSANLISGTYEVKNKVEFLLQSSSAYHPNGHEYFVSQVGKGVDEFGAYDTANDKKFTKGYAYDFNNNLCDLYLAHDVLDFGDDELLKTIVYDEYARIGSRYDYVETGNSLRTDYSYRFYDPDETDDDDYRHLETVATSYFTIEDDTYEVAKQESITIQNERGVVTDQCELFYKIDTDSIPGFLMENIDQIPDGTWGDPDTSVETKRLMFEYTDEQNPHRPTRIEEIYPDPSGETTDNVSRVLTKSYNEKGDMLKQRVYVDEANFVQSTFGYHPKYGLNNNSLSWQGLCYMDDDELVMTGNQIQTVKIYGNVNGNSDPYEGKYVVKECKLTDSEDANLDADESETWPATKYQYEVNGLVKRSEDTEGRITDYIYDENGYLQKEISVYIDESGDEQPETLKRVLYDDLGRPLIEVTSLGGATINYYDGFGRLYTVSKLVPAPGVQFDLDNDAIFNLTWFGNPANATEVSATVYGYDELGRQTYELKPSGGQVFKDYTISDQLKRQASYLNTVDLADAGTTLDDSESYIEYTFDSRGLKTEERKVDNTGAASVYWSVRYGYDLKGRATNTVWYDFDDNDPLTDDITAIKQTLSDYYANDKKKYEELYGFDEQSGTLEIEKRTDFYYDLLDKMSMSVVDPTNLAITTQYFHDAAGNLIAKIDPEGNCLITDYDNANRKTIEYFAVDEDGDLLDTDDVVYVSSVLDIDLTRANATPSKLTEYYNNNQVKSSSAYDYDDALLAYKQFAYDERSRIETVTEAIALDTDDLGNIITLGGNEYDTAVTTYLYSDSGSIENAYHIRITDAAGKNSYRRLDTFGRTLEILYAAADSQQVNFNGNGTIKEKAVWDDADGDGTYTPGWIKYYYDDFGRLTQIDYPADELSVDGGYIDYNYDGFGRTTSVDDYRTSPDNIGGTGTIAYEYNALGEKSAVTEQDGYVTSYTYTADGQKKSIQVHDDEVAPNLIYDVEYEFDTVLRLIKVQEPELTGTNDLIAEFAYTANGNRQSLTYSLDGTTVDTDNTNEVAVGYSYNADNLLNSIDTTGYDAAGATTTLAFDMNGTTVDGLGRLNAAAETLGAVTYGLTYTYDMRSQLITADIDKDADTGFWDASYTYGLDGNITDKTVNTTTTDSTYYDFNDGTDDLDLLLGATGFDPFTLTWDLNGNMIDKARAFTQTFDYNWDNKLRKATYAANKDISLVYDPSGNRVSRTVDEGTPVTTKYIVDTVGSLPTILCEIDPTDSSLIRSYVYANAQPLAMHTGPASAPRYFYLHDRLGSVRAVIDTDGDVANNYTYNPFGEDLTTECTETIDNPFKYTAQWHDKETGQYYLRARQYDPHIARFTTRDPIIGKLYQPITLHAYLYCGNGPINYIDPSGKIALIIGGSISFNSGAAGAAISTAMTAGGNMRGGAIGRALSVSMGAMARSAVIMNAVNITGGTFGLGSVLGYDMENRRFFGGSITWQAFGVGTGMSLSATADIAISNANSLNELSGGFMEVGGSVPFANSLFLNGVVGGSISRGIGNDIYLATISVGGSFGFDAGVEAHAFVGHAQVWPW